MLSFNFKNSKKKSGISRHCRIESEFLETDAGSDAVDSWRVFRIMSEFVRGFELLRKYGLAATIYGSARSAPENEYYQEAKELSAQLSSHGFSIITGGGHGIMEAANVGAYEVGGTSAGLNIELPEEQQLNGYTTENAQFEFFFSRKVMLAYASEVYVYFPGGFGTLDEFFEMLTLIQTKKIEPIPIVLYGREYWTPLVHWIETKLARTYRTIDVTDTSLYTVVDSVDEALKHILSVVDTKQTK